MMIYMKHVKTLLRDYHSYLSFHLNIKDRRKKENKKSYRYMITFLQFYYLMLEMKHKNKSVKYQVYNTRQMIVLMVFFSEGK